MYSYSPVIVPSYNLHTDIHILWYTNMKSWSLSDLSLKPMVNECEPWVRAIFGFCCLRTSRFCQAFGAKTCEVDIPTVVKNFCVGHAKNSQASCNIDETLEIVCQQADAFCLSLLTLFLSDVPHSVSSCRLQGWGCVPIFVRTLGVGHKNGNAQP